MKLTLSAVLLLFLLSCTRDHLSPDPTGPTGPTGPTSHTLLPFTVTVMDRAPYTAIVQWDEVRNIYNSDTIKYKISINGRLADSNLTKLTDTIRGISPDTAYNGRVYAYTRSGDTVSAPFFLEQLNGYIFFGDDNYSIRCYNLYSDVPVWRANVNATGYFLGSPAIVNNVLYINNSESGTWAINSKTGEKIWNTTYSGRAPFGSSTSPLYSNGKVYTVVSEGIYSLNAADGSVAWSYPADGTYAANPVLAGDLVITANLTSPRFIAALHTATGAVVWIDTIPTQICQSPVVYNNLLIFGGYDGKIYAVDNTTGKSVWTRDFSVDYNNLGSASVSPVIYKNMVIVANNNSGYYGLNAATGAIVWNFPAYNFSSPAIGNDKVYFTGLSGNGAIAYCLNAATGTQVWQTPYGRIDDWGTPIYVKNRIYIGHNMTYGYGIHVFNAQTGASVTTLASTMDQWGSEAIVDHDTTYYLATSGMQQ